MYPSCVYDKLYTPAGAHFLVAELLCIQFILNLRGSLFLVELICIPVTSIDKINSRWR